MMADVMKHNYDETSDMLIEAMRTNTALTKLDLLDRKNGYDPIPALSKHLRVNLEHHLRRSFPNAFLGKSCDTHFLFN